MMPAGSHRPRRVRVDRLILLALGILVILFLAGYLLARRARDFSWPYITSSVLLSFLGITNVILILTLLSLLMRNLIKVLIERRRNILGSRFKTKLVFTMLALWFVPSGIIFWAALHAIQGSVDRWFSTPVDRIAASSQEVVDAFYADYKERGSVSARRIRDRMESGRLLDPGRREEIGQALRERLREEKVDLVSLYRKDEDLPLSLVDPSVPRPGDLEGIPQPVLARGFSGEPFQWISHLGSGLVVRCGEPARDVSGKPIAVVVAGYYIPKDFTALTARINAYNERYRQDKAQRGSIKNVYIFAFAFITLLVLFSVTWIGLYLARGVTEPIGMLAQGTREISSGNLDFRVHVRTRDELGILAESFNRMTHELKAGKETIERSNRELLRSNQEIEERRRYIEALLQSITTGVISLDAEGRVTTLNRAAFRILALDSRADPVGRPYGELLARPALKEIAEAVENSRRAPDLTPAREITLNVEGMSLTLAVSITALPDGRGGAPGLLIVLEDLTPLMRAQRVAAWREVARRLAHEIKNPLTPIQLSAQRILKNFHESSPELPEVLEQGTQTIIREVATLKTLVDEFSRFARLPALSPVPCDLNQLLDGTVSLYDGMDGKLHFEKRYDPRLPRVLLDPEQIRRVFVNLIDNARDAMGGAGTITLTTAYFPDVEALRVEVADEGPGIPAEDRDRLFVPYFSTKKKGTGLGLAIVNRIVSDHHGYIRAESRKPRGARFIVELPARKEDAPGRLSRSE
ncbi:MAG TPA: ATP-binding protein [Candidatus Polarisedimenticolia bacterium]|jgi:two-component system nitrogen regulation sensor histidine kinase NtrY|nr:ATP-binding protein [Candidatus Polarisedimenticolia bacterium]